MEKKTETKISAKEKKKKRGEIFSLVRTYQLRRRLHHPSLFEVVFPLVPLLAEIFFFRIFSLVFSLV